MLKTLLNIFLKIYLKIKVKEYEIQCYMYFTKYFISENSKKECCSIHFLNLSEILLLNLIKKYFLKVKL